MAFAKPEVSIGVGLATAALVYSIYSNATPTLADIRAAEPGNQDIEATRKAAAWTAAGVVAAVSLISKDATVFSLGGAMVIALDWLHRHGNEVDPRTGKAATSAMQDAGMVDVGDDDETIESYAS